MSDQYLIARIADIRIAVRAQLVESVVVMGSMVPVFRAAPHVVGLFALRSRVVTVIDTQIALGMSPTIIASYQRVIITEIAGHAYAMLADEIEDITSLSTVNYRGSVSRHWKKLTEVIVDYKGKPMLVLVPERLVALLDKYAA